MTILSRLLAAISLTLVLGLSAAACGDDSSKDGDSALPDAAGASSEAPADDDEPDLDPEDAMLKFAQCMREHGVDMPDPSADGGIRVNGEGMSEDQMEAAQAACQKWMDMAEPEDGGPEMSEEEKQSFLDMAACMRERGYNFPDPTFDGGRVTQKVEKGRAIFRVLTTRRSRRTWRSAAPRPGWSRRAPRATVPTPTRRRAEVSRRSVWVATGVLLATGPLAGCSVPGTNDPADAAGETSPSETATVQRTDLTETLTESGQLGYGDPLDLPSGLTGTTTWLPTVGAVVENGEPLYRLDADPVLRLDGKVPAWRDLGPDVTSGRDVLQLERALTDLGYTDDLDMAVDGDWTWVTTVAVERWQRDHGLDDDGDLPLGRLVFTDGDVRVASVPVEDGTPVQPGTVVLQVGATQRTVTVSVDPTQQRLAPVRKAVELEFPDGTTARGRIREVEHVEATEQTDESLDVTIDVVGPEAKRKDVDKQLDGTSVQVGFSHNIAKDVLAVPVTALVALVDGGYGVEKVGADGATAYVAVSTGSFSETLVEVESPDLAEGDEVVVTP